MSTPPEQEIVLKKIDTIIKEHPVVLFMKGSAKIPHCGFSALVVTVLKKLNVNFYDVDVLQDHQIREGVKVYSNWPTIPQLYVKGEFIGGCDIVKTLYENKELEKLFLSHDLIKA